MTAQNNVTEQEVITFWFGDATTDPGVARSRSKFWYGNSSAIDKHITERFQSIHEQATAGMLSDWENSPAGALALVVILDQFSRNIYRGTARAFAADIQARELASRAIANGADASLHLLCRIFLYHPLHHSENLQDQDQVVQLYRDLKADAPAEWQELVEGFLEYAIEHRDIIARFGRFPHRNRLLNRQSTEEEMHYLAAGARRYGQ